MTDRQPSDMVVKPPRKSFWRNLSVVWLVPVIALAVTLAIAWQSYADRGALIEIHWENAAGVAAGETTLRYRDVVVGTVESVAFEPDLSSVVVHARLDKTVAGNLPEDAQFWVVRPEVSTSGISGLSTVLSGVYIQAAFTPRQDGGATRFDGLEETPLVMPGTKGTRVTLRSSSGDQLTAGAPIIHKGIEVGKIETPRLPDTGNGVLVDAFINAPYDQRITSATRFWQTSGISVSFGPSGLNLNIGSLSSIIRGGIAFDTVFSGGDPVRDDAVFDLFEDEDSARGSVFNETVDNAVDLSVEFDESVSGLSAGSQVMYRGVRIGTVSTLGAFVEDSPTGQVVKLRATISIDPNRLGLDPDAPPAETIAFFAGAVEKGLRARLAAPSLFSQSLVVELAEIEDASPASLGVFADTAPLIPSVPSDLPDLTATAEGLLTRVDNLPVEELLDQAISTLAAVESFAGDERLRSAPEAFTSLMNDARGLITSEETQAIPGELQDTLAELRGVVEDLRTADAVGKLVSALDSASEAADTVTGVASDVSGATSELPALVQDLRNLTAKANSLEVEQFLEIAGNFLDSADRLIDQPTTRALPESLTRALDEARQAIAQLREGGIVENANATLASARDAAAAVEEAANSLPDLSSRLQRLIAQAESVVAGYGSQSTFNRETVSALREVREAAEAINKLARSIERNPNSLLFGR
ncbi:MlaD family protein [Pseudooceanicola sp. C21-150M6]|uniref:MlaD family protein n=1 Tax=Pseudooceanicola sp. C21-150M6 TaxID=3434355 RepID=UPI003D7FACD3